MTANIAFMHIKGFNSLSLKSKYPILLTFYINLNRLNESTKRKKKEKKKKSCV